jgi:hypothetical protein
MGEARKELSMFDLVLIALVAVDADCFVGSPISEKTLLFC